MKEKLKHVCIYIIVGLVVLISFKMPEILFKMDDKKLEITIYEKNKEKRLIDIEAEKIYLVKAIHSIFKEADTTKYVMVEENKNTKISVPTNESIDKNRNVEIVESEDAYRTRMDNLKKELTKLNEYKIIKTIEIDENTKKREIYKRTSNSKYKVHYTNFKIDSGNIEVIIEEKTGKIISIHIGQDKLYSENNYEDIIDNYIKYLDLYIIEDWTWEEKILKSKKAGLAVSLVRDVSDDYGGYILHIFPLDFLKSNYKNIQV